LFSELFAEARALKYRGGPGDIVVVNRDVQ
jgi:hypothetical protein